MKFNILIVGLIALIMLVAVPAMAIAPSSSTLEATGTIVQTLSITAEKNIAFGNFVVGDNRQDNGNIVVTSAFVPTWRVTAATSDGYGYMRTGAGAPVTGTYLTNQLKEYNYLAPTPDWKNVQGLTFSGSASTSMTETFLQNVLIGDAPGKYSTVVTYTIAAV